MQDILCDAIKNRQLVKFYYEHGMRVVEPHMVAYDEYEHLTLSAWFLRGHSNSDAGQGWRHYLVKDISQLEVLPETFAGPRDGYKPSGGQSFHNVQCAL